MNLFNVGVFDGRKLYTGLSLDYTLRLWAPTSASRAISEVAELLVFLTLDTLCNAAIQQHPVFILLTQYQHVMDRWK